jgi:hypothetical protein
MKLILIQFSSIFILPLTPNRESGFFQTFMKLLSVAGKRFFKSNNENQIKSKKHQSKY